MVAIVDVWKDAKGFDASGMPVKIDFEIMAGVCDHDECVLDLGDM